MAGSIATQANIALRGRRAGEREAIEAGEEARGGQGAVEIIEFAGDEDGTWSARSAALALT